MIIIHVFKPGNNRSVARHSFAAPHLLKPFYPGAKDLPYKYIIYLHDHVTEYILTVSWSVD